jgi:biopolymer transport protein ExbB
MAEVKTAAAKSGSNAPRVGKPKNANYSLINFIIVIACLALAEGIFHFVFGASGNFRDAEKHVPLNFAGTMYSGGWVVPVLMATALTLICFVVERALTIMRANGKVNNAEFVRKVQYHIKTLTLRLQSVISSLVL